MMLVVVFMEVVVLLGGLVNQRSTALIYEMGQSGHHYIPHFVIN